MSDALLRRREGAVEYLTLNRPDRLNALSSELAHALADALTEIAADESARVVVLTGAGRGFCAGLDILERGSGGDQSGIARLSEIVLTIRSMPQIVVAAVNGAAVGGGFAFALAADLRIASDTAKFKNGFIDIGLTGCELGSSQLMPQYFGVSLAAELMLTGRALLADRAYAAGFVTDVVTNDELPAATDALVAELVGKSPMGLRLTKATAARLVNEPDLALVISEEVQVQLSCMQDPDFFANTMSKFTQRER